MADEKAKGDLLSSAIVGLSRFISTLDASRIVKSENGVLHTARRIAKLDVSRLYARRPDDDPYPLVRGRYWILLAAFATYTFHIELRFRIFVSISDVFAPFDRRDDQTRDTATLNIARREKRGR